jgi:hypothetical protein
MIPDHFLIRISGVPQDILRLLRGKPEATKKDPEGS